MRDAWRRMRRACASVPGIWDRFRGKWIAEVNRVSSLHGAHKAILYAYRRCLVLKWRLAAIAVARATKIGASLHRLLRVLYTNLHPFADCYLGQLVLGFICRLGFYVFKVAYRIGSLHSKFLRLEFEAMQQLELGEIDA